MNLYVRTGDSLKKSYNFGNVRIAIHADIDYEDGVQLSPFFNDSKEKETVCEFKKSSRLELPKGKKIFESSNVNIWETKSGLVKTYSIPLRKEPSAVITETANGYRCVYDEKQEEYFSFGVNLMNAIGLERIAFDYQMFILHCSYIEYEGEAILFAGTSGVGKSTRADMWNKEFGTEIINGDKAGLFLENGRLMACGLPVAGSSNVFINRSLPVRAIVILKKSVENSTRMANMSEAIHEIYYNMIINEWNSSFCTAAIDFAVETLKHTNIYISECNLDVSSVMEQLDRLSE